MVYEGKYYGTLKSELKGSGTNNNMFPCSISTSKARFTYNNNTRRINSASLWNPHRWMNWKKADEHRGTESEESLQARVNKASYELSFKDHFDEVVVNDNLENAERPVPLLKFLQSWPSHGFGREYTIFTSWTGSLYWPYWPHWSLRDSLRHRDRLCHGQ